MLPAVKKTFTVQNQLLYNWSQSHAKNLSQIGHDSNSTVTDRMTLTKFEPVKASKGELAVGSQQCQMITFALNQVQLLKLDLLRQLTCNTVVNRLINNTTYSLSHYMKTLDFEAKLCSLNQLKNHYGKLQLLSLKYLDLQTSWASLAFFASSSS